ncbi:hypothetical protein WR25_12098 [Diploscapter pachys]|uniref:Uncharacterized protein n=1 Tax=Diploscapter pachys TaxID=2018661 RepID=A0A2A2JGP3_9BILA|nr:hypothetical protein WR25_12098 [Diploscapter pachys]
MRNIMGYWWGDLIGSIEPGRAMDSARTAEGSDLGSGKRASATSAPANQRPAVVQLECLGSGNGTFHWRSQFCIQL